MKPLHSISVGSIVPELRSACSGLQDSSRRGLPPSNGVQNQIRMPRTTYAARPTPPKAAWAGRAWREDREF